MANNLKKHKALSKWKTLKRDLLLEAGIWFKVYKEEVKLPDGRVIDDYYTIERPDYVEVIALNQNHQIIGLWHYKHGVERVSLGLPAGYIESNETPLNAAKRELREEAGLVSKRWEKLGDFVIEGSRSPSKAHIFMAYDCLNASPAKSDDLEDTVNEWLSIEKWLEYLANGNVAVIGAATAILLAVKKLANNTEEEGIRL